ncbi:lysM and putative peptidoglycan-binding domain-containing protein 1 [Python bivittatus]|uniref:LysM and putative peptidoglycan-binding domain-containing protein 1 n=1 Tax=Python bivittatus TaxID=176946 RepID=A0A9F2R3P7_PYTBI|nr:lysM and putative peptidoglycan-binding domain-containing protein 1 [Python bivittatus]
MAPVRPPPPTGRGKGSLPGRAELGLHFPAGRGLAQPFPLRQSGRSPRRAGRGRSRGACEDGEGLHFPPLPFPSPPLPLQTEQIKRANRLYTNDSIFLKKTLSIPVPAEPKALSNGLDFEDEDEEEGREAAAEAVPPDSAKKPKPPRKNGTPGGSVPKHDLSAADFLFKLDSEIRRSKQAAAKKLREGESA